MAINIQPPAANFLITDRFTAEKTNDIYQSVVFKYENETWEGVLPVYLERQGIEFDEEELSEKIPLFYGQLNPDNRAPWVAISDANFPGLKKNDQTYLVLKALYSGNWECRVHGPVPKVNPQPSARIQSLKKMGYVIGSRRKYCKKCTQTTMHDILVMLPPFSARFVEGNHLRKPMSEALKLKIKRLFVMKEAAFGITRSPKELIIDHKFPSQRWSVPETDNLDNASNVFIKKKFQLLNNQTNLWKSRYCDNCVKTNKRGVFMGIEWYYEGDENWVKAKDDESGCIGCPWYDTELWKEKLKQKLG